MKTLTVVLIAAVMAASFAGCSRRFSQTAWCAYHASRLVHDVRSHHMGWATFQGVMSAHHCARAIRG